MPDDAGRPAAEAGTIRWGRRKRLEFIDFRLTWDGRINRSDLIERFRISVPQASGDLADYQQMAPDNMVYDKSGKTYVAAEGFVPRFEQPAEAYLNQLAGVAQGIVPSAESWAPAGALSPEHLASVPRPARRVDQEALRAVVRAIRRGGDLEISYQSMSRIEPHRRWIGPRALAFDGSRWHVRAWCHENGDYRDFVVSRILALAGERPGEPRPVPDKDWEETLEYVLVPHPDLTDEQKHAVATEFGMIGGRLTVPVPRALKLYFERQYHLKRDAVRLPPEQHQVVVENVDTIWPQGESDPFLPFDDPPPP